MDKDRHHDFLNPLPSHRFDNFLPRRAILNALVEQLPKFAGVLLDIGCGQMPYKSILVAPPSRVTKYIGLDMPDGQYGKMGPFDLNWNGQIIPLEDNSIDCAIMTEVLEQCPAPENIMREAARVLKPDGILFFTVPFLWPVHDPPLDQYRFTPYALERHLRNAGFVNVELKMPGGWDRSLAQMIAVWVGRRPMRRPYRALLKMIALPVVHLLTALDKPPSPEHFHGTMMITGISGTAVKGNRR